MKITVLEEGSYSVAADKKFIPFVEGVDDPRDRPASLFIHVRPFLLETKKDLILFDTGLGYLNNEGIPFINLKIKEKGYSAEEVTKVLMSHLHFDHSGGMLRKVNGVMKLNFVNADYYIQKNELENAILYPGSSYDPLVLEHLRRTDNLILIDGDGMIDNYISYTLTGAHCKYHQVFLIEEDGEKIFFGGDVLPEGDQLVRNFIAKYDLDGRAAMELRKEFGMKAVEENWTCLFYHSKNKEVCKVEILNGAFILKDK